MLVRWDHSNAPFHDRVIHTAGCQHAARGSRYEISRTSAERFPAKVSGADFAFWSSTVAEDQLAALGLKS
jgi:hypothetical protein